VNSGIPIFSLTSGTAKPDAQHVSGFVVQQQKKPGMNPVFESGMPAFRNLGASASRR
jgi:hypothetical protein